MQRCFVIQETRANIKILAFIFSTLLISLAFSAESSSGTNVNAPLKGHYVQSDLTVCPNGPPVCQYKNIQDAIDAAPEPPTSSGGLSVTKIRIAPGIYEENLVIRKSVIIEGAGQDKTILRPGKITGRDAWIGILIVTNILGVNVDLSGLHIQSINGGNQIGVMILGVLARAKIHQNRIQAATWGIYIDGALSNVIAENEFLSPDPQKSTCTAIIANRISAIDIYDNSSVGDCVVRIAEADKIEFFEPFSSTITPRVIISKNKFTELIIDNSTEIVINNNQFKRLLIKQSSNVSIEENTFEKAPFVNSGLEIASSRNVIVKKNIIEDNGGSGLYVSLDIGNQKPSVTVIENRMQRNAYFGILSENPDYINFCKGNIVKENKQGDYGTGPRFGGQPNAALKQKCEGN